MMVSPTRDAMSTALARKQAASSTDTSWLRHETLIGVRLHQQISRIERYIWQDILNEKSYLKVKMIHYAKLSSKAAPVRLT